ncbi:MAG: hypothetical protein KC646_08445 [Candidatus Cloacimonetes bacterium]|nr:hypothetical protein [Candidatus Cloacimonadota bacterium]
MQNFQEEIVIEQVSDCEVHINRELMYFDDQCISCNSFGEKEIQNTIEYLPSTLMRGLIDQPSLENRLPICTKCNSKLDFVHRSIGFTSLVTIGSLAYLVKDFTYLRAEIVYWSIFLVVVFMSSYLFELYDRFIHWKFLNFKMALKDKTGQTIVFKHKNPRVIQCAIDRAKRLIDQ